MQDESIRLRKWVLPQWPVALVLLSAPWLLQDAWTANWPTFLIFLPFLASVVLFGLPHGAIDDQIIAGILRKPKVFWVRLALIDTAYLTIALLYLAFWFFQPASAFAFFVVLTWFHWGQGDLHVLKKIIQARYADFPPLAGIIVLLRGSLPMALTAMCYPGVYTDVARWTIRALRPGNDLHLASGIYTILPVTYLVLLSAITLYLAYISMRTIQDKSLSGWIDAAEILLLFFLFSSIHPLLSIGLYFCLWHSTRHLSRLQGWLNCRQQEEGEFQLFPAKVLLRSIPNTLLSILGALGLWFFLGGIELPLTSILGIYLVVIAILTLPHTAVVIWMDWMESNFCERNQR